MNGMNSSRSSLSLVFFGPDPPALTKSLIKAMASEHLITLLPSVAHFIDRCKGDFKK